MESFFEELAANGHQPLLEGWSGTLRFDLDDNGSVEHWYVTVHKGDVTVSNDDAAADAIMPLDKALFDRIVRGEVNTQAALLRGLIEPEGDLGLLVGFQRLFQGPPRDMVRSGQ